MTDKLELDPRILQKNLEISKLTQQVDSLKSQIVDLKEVVKAYTEHNKELIDSLEDMSRKLKE